MCHTINMKKETTVPGPFGPKRPLNLQTASDRKVMTLWASGYLQRLDGAWNLTTRGQDLYYVA